MTNDALHPMVSSANDATPPLLFDYAIYFTTFFFHPLSTSQPRFVRITFLFLETADKSELTADSFSSWNDDDDAVAFSDYVSRVREEMVQKRMKFPVWSKIKDSAMIPGGGEIWYGDPPYYVKLIGPPGTLAGDILRLESDLHSL